VFKSTNDSNGHQTIVSYLKRQKFVHQQWCDQRKPDTRTYEKYPFNDART